MHGRLSVEREASLFEELRKDLALYLDEEKIAKIYEAYIVAEAAHRGQKRYTGEDYITHPVAVAKILARMHMDHQSIMGALLHDVIEDTPVEKSTLAKQFGDAVAELVDGVSKLTQINFETQVEAQAENFRKMLLAMVRDIRVIIIKLADRLHNMRTLSGCLPEKRRRISRETLEIYAPIAHRLGMHNFFIEFEDLGFSCLYPTRYRILKSAVRKARGNRKEIMTEIENSLMDALAEREIPFLDIHGREKHLYSIYKKMRNKHIPFSEIMDVYAFRIIVKDVDTCYRTLGVIHNLYKPVPERFKDYIAIPKINSYQSLHTTLFGPYGVPIEIQIRTQEIDRVAENGIAAHWLYKSTDQAPDKAQIRARRWLKGLVEMQESTKSPTEFIENVKVDLFPDEVYVFTPKGSIMELPSGSSAVDFAYAVHSDIGNSCIAAKINRRLAPLATVLVNGQTVEIITAPGARPNPAWLNFVVTSKARSNIRHFIKGQRRRESIDLGNELLSRSLHTLGFSLSEFTEEDFSTVVKELKFKNHKDMIEAIGLGNQLPIVVARKLSLIANGDKTELARESTHFAKTPIIIKGSQGMIVSLADCCHPIPGDPIVGVFNPGKGLVVHLGTCSNIAKICAVPERCIDVQWEENISGEFSVDIRVEVINERGVLAKLASVIASALANIDDISIDTNEGRFNVILLTISVADRIHLAKIMRKLREIKEVTKISRFKQ